MAVIALELGLLLLSVQCLEEKPKKKTNQRSWLKGSQENVRTVIGSLHKSTAAAEKNRVNYILWEEYVSY